MNGELIEAKFFDMWAGGESVAMVEVGIHDQKELLGGKSEEIAL